MSAFTLNTLLYGSESAPQSPLQLRAGPLSLNYESGSLRHIKLGSVEVLHQVYAAVRDHNWGTVPDMISDEQIERDSDSFRISYRSTHKQGVVDFIRDVTIIGQADGTITFSMDGEARSSFKRNRIGFCVLHPSSCAGQLCTVEHVDGQRVESAFPKMIAPHQPFYELRAITHGILPGLSIEVRMEGDTFEMEDQRNWTDASFKTYCTPLGLPFPVTVETGTRISQKITLRLIGKIPQITSGNPMLTVTIGDHHVPLTPIGLGSAHHRQPLTELEILRLRLLNLAHLRIDLRLDQRDVEFRLLQAVEEAAMIGAALEIAVFVTANADAELHMLRESLEKSQPRIKRWLIFHQGEKSTQGHWLRLAREVLGPWAEHASLGAGTDAFFAELNRQRPPVTDADFVTYSLNATVHAVDNASVTETLSTQGETLRSALAFSGGLPVIVSPITFRMRWNPNATGPEPQTPAGELPPQVDARQMSLYGAGWTLGSIKYLAESGAASLTYYETTGWRGVMETSIGSNVPDRFRSVPGGVFPMYHVIADITEYAGGQVIISRSNDNIKVDSLVLRKDGRTRILLANHTADPQPVHLPAQNGHWWLRLLDATNAEFSMRDPEQFRRQAATELSEEGDGLRLVLPPLAFARLDYKSDDAL